MKCVDLHKKHASNLHPMGCRWGLGLTAKKSFYSKLHEISNLYKINIYWTSAPWDGGGVSLKKVLLGN